MKDKDLSNDPLFLQWQEQKNRDIIRVKIRQEAGDVQALLGTTADGTQLALYQLAELIDAIATSKTLAELKTKIAPRVPIAQQHLADVAAGTVKPTFVVKGVESVIKDIETRATSVSNILIDAKKVI